MFHDLADYLQSLITLPVVTLSELPPPATLTGSFEKARVRTPARAADSKCNQVIPFSAIESSADEVTRGRVAILQCNLREAINQIQFGSMTFTQVDGNPHSESLHDVNAL